MNKKSVITGNLCALYCALIWGTTFIVTKNLMANFNAAEILFSRFFIALTVLTAIRLIRGKEKFEVKKSKSDELLLFICGFTGLFLYGTLEIISMKYTYASNTSTIVSANPFFIAVFSMLFLKTEKPRFNFFVGFLIAISGVALISFNGASEFGLNPLGDLLALCCAMAWGIYTPIIKKLSDKGYPTTYITRHVYFWGALLMAASLPFFGLNTDFSRFTERGALLSLLFLGIIASCTCYLSWNYSAKLIGPVNSSIYIYSIPVVTIIFASIVLKENVNFASVAGIVLVVIGTVVSSLKFKRKAA